MWSCWSLGVEVKKEREIPGNFSLFFLCRCSSPVIGSVVLSVELGPVAVCWVNDDVNTSFSYFWIVGFPVEWWRRQIWKRQSFVKFWFVLQRVLFATIQSTSKFHVRKKIIRLLSNEHDADVLRSDRPILCLVTQGQRLFGRPCSREPSSVFLAEYQCRMSAVRDRLL